MTAISESDAMALQVTDVTKHYDSGFTLDDVTFGAIGTKRGVYVRGLSLRE